jgi:tetratricopeptide (TPR) repeat protein
MPTTVLIAASIIGLLIGTGAGFLYMKLHHRRSPSGSTASFKPKAPPRPPSSDGVFAKGLPAVPNTAITPGPARKALPRKRAGELKEKPVSIRDTTKINKKSIDTGNPLEAFTKEAEAGNYASALRIFDNIPQNMASEKTTQILRLRALYALGRTTEASRLLDNLALDDGELFLIKARLLIDKGETGQAMQCLDKSVQVGAQMAEEAALRRDYLYYRAVCMTLIYEVTPSEERRKDALDGWFEVKNSLRKHPDHAYFRRAVLEMQRIGNGPAPSKG